MDQDILSAADSLALQRIQAQDYRDAAKAAEVQRNVEAARYAAALTQAEADRTALAAWRASNLAISERVAAVQEEQAAKLATPSQERWMELFQMNLTVRLGPTIISTATPTNVILDIATDPVEMTMAQWPRVKAELDKLA